MPPKSHEDLESGYEGVGEFYDFFADDSDIPFYIEYAQKTGSPILDLAAGTGRVTFRLAQDGFDIVALEKSPSMMAEARKKLDALPKSVSHRVKLVTGSMKQFSLNQKFALVIVPNSFGHLLTTRDQISTIESIKEHLQDQGIFILDLYPGEHQYEHATFEDASVELPNGQTVIRSGVIKSDFRKKLMRVELRYTVFNADGRIANQVDVTSGVALLFSKDVDYLLMKTGMHVVNEFGDFDKNPFTPESGRRILILIK